jgi:hypothetical protein
MGDVGRLPEPAQRDLAQQGLLLLGRQAAVMSVAMKPGATQLTVMLREPSSRASARVMPATPALAAA